MPLLSTSDLTKYFGAEEIFSAVTLEVHPGDHIALVGANGTGKSTLLRVLVGELEPDGGQVQRARGLRLGYLPQVPDFAPEGTLWQAMTAVFADLIAMGEELRQLEQRMAEADEAARQTAMQRYGILLEAYEQQGGFTYETRIAQVLGGLGFSPDEYHRPIRQLSGGERTRALLARLLLEEPDLLLLDEPTNHLDIEGIAWLEETLREWRGACIVVAHDRAFLDGVANRVWELEGGRIQTYRGNYSAYVQQRAERRAQLLEAYEEQQAFIARTEDYIRRYMAGQRSTQAKGRLKRLENLERIERPVETPAMRMALSGGLRSGDLVLGMYDLAVGYDPAQPLVRVDEVELRRTQRAALVGPNGSGKTTLIRTLLGQVPPLRGRYRLGAAVYIGYFAQIQEAFDPEASVLDTLLAAGLSTVSEARHFLARYAFRGEDVFKPMGVLSGGERTRVALAILSLQHANFLLLDEPTNNLDIASQEVLEEVLSGFSGTILLVSHDRYLIRRLATHIWAIADGRLHVFEGYDAYAAWHEARKAGVSVPRPEAQAEAEEKARRLAERQQEKERQRLLARREKRLAELEATIAQHETRLKELTLALEQASRRQDVTQVTRLGQEYHQVQSRLDALIEEWSEVAAGA